VSAAEATRQTGCQLYLIGPPTLAAGLVAQALEAGDFAALLVRPAPDAAQGAALRQVCAGRTAFLVQDDLDLVIELGADGAHVGAAAAVREARARLGPDRILGASCGTSRHAAMLAGEDGADYIAFGDARGQPLPELIELVAWWSELFVLPCLALGAFDDAGCAAMARAGADFIGVSDAVWHHQGGTAAGVRSLREAIAGA
jgi:thiamine-phosphate pyrophosphorylase